MRIVETSKAASEIASSMRVQISIMRVSSVGYFALGLRSHQILVESFMTPALIKICICR